MKTDISKIVAIMGIKENDPEKIGKFTVVGESETGMSLGMISEREVEFISEEDFEEPKRENFEQFVKGLLRGDAQSEKGVTIHYLTEVPE